MVLFLRVVCYQPTCEGMIVLKNFEDLIFVHDKLPVKTAKIMSLENLYTYGTDMFIGI